MTDTKKKKKGETEDEEEKEKEEEEEEDGEAKKGGEKGKEIERTDGENCAAKSYCRAY